MARLNHIAVTIAMSVLICVLAEELYSDRFDDIDVLSILQNKEVRMGYYNCFMKLAPCTSPEQIELTGTFSEAYQTKCKKCTEKQKKRMQVIEEWYVNNEPDEWKLIIEKTVENMKNAGQ
ncbi:hypothetical protein P5V15_005386 [Pogonomyrmex californicus]